MKFGFSLLVLILVTLLSLVLYGIGYCEVCVCVIVFTVLVCTAAVCEMLAGIVYHWFTVGGVLIVWLNNCVLVNLW